jgi:hypothetical protein
MFERSILADVLAAPIADAGMAQPPRLALGYFVPHHNMPSGSVAVAVSC